MRQAYSTDTLIVGRESGYKTIAVGSSAFNDLVEHGSTFNFCRAFDSPDVALTDSNEIVIQLTCRGERRGKSQNFYYYAYHRNPFDMLNKKLSKKYLGKGDKITFEKLESVAQSFYDNMVASVEARRNPEFFSTDNNN